MSVSSLSQARLAHVLESLGESTGPLARYFARFFDAMVDAGFTRAEALQLTLEVERAILSRLATDIQRAARGEPDD